MPLPLALALLPAGASLAASIKQILEANKLPSGMQSWLDFMKQRATGGLSPMERADIAAVYGPQIARETTAAQNRMASALASRGVSDSTSANESIAAILGESVGKLPQITAQADLQARNAAIPSYSDLLMQTEGLKMAGKEAGWGSLAGSLMEAFDTITDKYWPDKEDNLSPQNAFGLQTEGAARGVLGSGAFAPQPAFQLGVRPQRPNFLLNPALMRGGKSQYDLWLEEILSGLEGLGD